MQLSTKEASTDRELEELCRKARINLVELIHKSKSSHLGTGLSTIEALVTLYFRILNVSPEAPQSKSRDRFILSKAHGSAALYTVLSMRGFFSHEFLSGFYQNGGTLPGHLSHVAAPGVETSGGSLGHGLSLGLGFALAAKMKKESFQTYVLLGDGECNEGSVWEAAMLASHLQMDNLTALIDCNGLQSLGKTADIIDQRNLNERWRSFGWEDFTIDGHSVSEITEALTKKRENKKPRVILLKTIKGKGVSFMENELLWHYRSPNHEELSRALSQLKADQ